MSSNRYASSSVLSIVLALYFVSGCGKSNPAGRLPFDGTVTFQGKPLDQGTVEFVPLDGKAKIGTGGMIKDGKYSFTADRGLPSGRYIIRVFSASAGAAKQDAMPGDSQAADPSNDAPVATERIPDQYNVNSREEVEIKSNTKNRFALAIP